MSRVLAVPVIVLSLILGGRARLAAQSVLGANFPRHDWQPTEAPPGARYVGRQACVQCHVREAAEQAHTPMGRALELVSQCTILHRHPVLSVRLGRYTYRIVTRGAQSTYTVTDGVSTFSAPIGWAFGQGEAGQTYVYQHDGNFYESRVSFFNDTQSLDLTLGYEGTNPHNVVEAAGRHILADEVRDCFACHSTAAVSAGKLQLDKLTPGITCEGCHGPGYEHMKAVQAGDVKSVHIFNPGRLDAQDLSDFCGSCHRSWQAVEMEHLQGIVDVRFQPYRLELSRCFNPVDPRISCTACHDPHEQLRTDPASYDAKCLACHLKRGEASKTFAKKMAPACPVGRKACVTCHMPKYALPGAHYKFTDHYIRVVRAGEPYPE